jgi:predicted YcjX-like family ATPase
MLIRQIAQVCREEFGKAWRAAAAAYEALRAADERVLQTLFAFFQDR